MYRIKNDQAKLARGAQFHTKGDQIATDIGVQPVFKKANVLLSKNFRYFGGNGYEIEKFTALKVFVSRLAQGHRVKLLPAVRIELNNLKADVWAQFPKKKVLGTPGDAKSKLACNKSQGAGCLL
ncbi:MAG: hypothetical protein IT289_05140 [Oligoflexia bacterium]|nr:hypothetical protein [Oligoflexia bacterium]